MKKNIKVSFGKVVVNGKEIKNPIVRGIVVVLGMIVVTIVMVFVFGLLMPVLFLIVIPVVLLFAALITVVAAFSRKD